MTRKITFDTLHKAKLEDIFKQCAIHLLTQNKRSADNGNCQYRSTEGLSCAIGGFITNRQYARIKNCIEGCNMYEVSNRYLNKKGLTKASLDLLNSLQCLHDSKGEDEWLNELIDLGTRYRVNFDFLQYVPNVDMSQVTHLMNLYHTQYTRWGKSHFLPCEAHIEEAKLAGVI